MAKWNNRQIYDDIGLGRFYRTYMKNAETRNKEFPLTYEDFKSITSQPCHYCDSEPEYRVVNQGKYKYETYASGIDRMNNDLGYTPGNIVPCCTACNRAKNNMSYEKFISYLKAVAKKWA